MTSKLMTKKNISELFKRFKRYNPTPTTELKYNSTFELLVAVILSAQATDISVNKATASLFEVANTPETLLALGEQKLKNYIKTIGLYNTKATNVLKMCQQLLDKYQGQVPNTRPALEKLPGVGRKTANVILNTAFGEPTMAVDTHIFRVANRLGLTQGKTPLQVEQQLVAAIPKRYLYDAHHWLILHGRYICQARRPLCEKCAMLDLCQYPDKSS